MGVDFKHGLTGYVKHKCRCLVCRAAKAAAQARYRVNEPSESRVRQNQANKRYRDRQKWGEECPEEYPMPSPRSEAALLPSDWSY